MAQNVLVTEALSEEMIKSGEELVERLDEANSEVKSAFWLLFPEERIWRLIIASPLVATEGPKSFYKRIVSANEGCGEQKTVALNDIGLADTNQQIVALLRFAIGTGNGISGIRFSRNTINGTLIEDAYIYRSTT